MRFAKWHNTIARLLRCVVAIALVVGSMSGCSRKQNIVAMADVNIAQWSEPVSVTLKNEQAESVGQLTIVLHVNRHFKAKQVEFEIVSMTADFLRCSEKITATPTVEWPVATAQSVDIEIPYRHNVLMRKAGEYIYTIKPLTPLQGVEAIGISYKTEKQ